MTAASTDARAIGWRTWLAVWLGSGVAGFVLFVLAILLLLLLAWHFWPSDTLTQRERVIQEITVVTPPPPPPPEEKIMEEEPEIIEPPEEEPEIQKDVEQPSEQPSEAPSEAPATSEPAGLDRPADAGSDSFRLAAGGGGGLFGRGGGGLGGGSWGAFVETHIRRALQRDPKTRSASGFLNVMVDIDGTGRFTGARLRSSTGNAELDDAVRRVLATLPPLTRGLPANQNGRTYATINMRRTGG
jgi:protein TonB